MTTTDADSERIYAERDCWLRMIEDTGFRLYGWNSVTQATLIAPDGRTLVDIEPAHVDLIRAIAPERVTKP
jgi:hypothetical protein